MNCEKCGEFYSTLTKAPFHEGWCLLCGLDESRNKLMTHPAEPNYCSHCELLEETMGLDEAITCPICGADLVGPLYDPDKDPADLEL